MSFKKKGYKIIKNTISQELAGFIYDYFLNKRMVAKTLMQTGRFNGLEEYFGNWSDSQIPDTYSHYSDIAMETLLQNIKPRIEQESNCSLVETYSYARIYKKGDVLHRHKDRSSCEISATLNLGGPNWSIFIEPDSSKGGVVNGVYVSNNTKGIEVILNPGDMLIYRGCDLEHWREPFQHDDCAQVFLHYNDAFSSKAAINRFDGRQNIGLPANTSFKNR